jgi:opacity protein-like surface antigen
MNQLNKGLNMKKLAIASAILALSSSALAMNEEAFYFKANVFGNIPHKLSLQSSATSVDGIATGTTIAASGTQENGDWGAGFGAGVGYHFMDNIRTEFNIAYFNEPKSHFKYNETPTTPGTAGATGVAGTSTLTATGWTGLLNAYMDLVDMGPAKLYVGGGLGFSYLEPKITVDKAAVAANGGTSILTAGTTATYKQEMSFAWSLGAGFSFEAAQNVSLDIGYQYVDLGGSKDTLSESSNSAMAASFPFENLTAHNIVASVRFCM